MIETDPAQLPLWDDSRPEPRALTSGATGRRGYGQLFSVGGGRVAHVFIAETQGYFKEDLALEDVRDNWGTITDRDGFGVPNGLPEETAMFLPFFK